MSTVLIVDDEADARLIAKLSLQAEGHEVLEAATGEEALDAVRARRPDIVLLDIELPGMDGWSVMEQWKQDPELAALPVVIFTAHVDLPTIDAYRRLGRPPTLGKPFTREALVGIIADSLSGRSTDT